MSAPGPLRLGVAELLRHPGLRREVQRTAVLDGLATSTARVVAGAPVELDLVVEAIGADVVVEGTVSAPWEAECRRCLELVEGRLAADVREVFERHPTEGETYPLEDDEIDLEPLAREAVLLELPLAPLCGPTCLGPAPEAFPAIVEGAPVEVDADDDGGEAPPDPRWAALDQLRFDEGA